MAKRKKSKPDHVEKVLEDYNDVFADIINGCLFSGEEIIKEDELSPGPTASHYKDAQGTLSEQIRDVCKFSNKDGRRYCIFGIENQSVSCNTMPMRVMGYDFAMYRHEVKELIAENERNGTNVEYGQVIPDGQKIAPVISVVMYYGKGKWTGPRTLYDMLNIPDELKKYVSDYKLNIIEIATLSDEELARLRGDFQSIAEYFAKAAQHRLAELCYNNKRLKHPEEVLEFFKTFAKTEWANDIERSMVKDAIAEKGEITMKDFFDIRNEQKLKDMEVKMEKSKAEARAEAKAEAKAEIDKVKEDEQEKHANSIVQFVQNIMKNVNCSSIDEACKLMGCSLQEYYAAKAFLAKK